MSRSDSAAVAKSRVRRFEHLHPGPRDRDDHGYLLDHLRRSAARPALRTARPSGDPGASAGLESRHRGPWPARPTISTGAGNSRSSRIWRLTRPVANFNLTGVGEPERLQGARATASLFSTLHAQPLFGRIFTEDEQLDPGKASSVAVLELRALAATVREGSRRSSDARSS